MNEMRSTSTSTTGGRSPDNGAIPLGEDRGGGGASPPTPDIDVPDTEVGDHKKWKKLDINDLLGL